MKITKKQLLQKAMDAEIDAAPDIDWSQINESIILSECFSRRDNANQLIGSVKISL